MLLNNPSSLGLQGRVPEMWLHDAGTYDLQNVTCCQRAGFQPSQWKSASIWVRPEVGWTYWWSTFTGADPHPFNDSLSVYLAVADITNKVTQSAMVAARPNVCSEMWVGDEGMRDIKVRTVPFRSTSVDSACS